MYTPDHFKEADTERLETLIREHPFGMLITVHEGLPFASHLPFLYEQRGSNIPVLLAHITKANPQWEHLVSGQTALAVFQGPHAYISPSWYASPGVPTWNYAVAHVYGKARILESETEIEALLERLTAVYERKQPKPWEPNLTGERRTKLLGMIGGFEIPIERIEGKFKLSQNRSAEDQELIAEHLAESGAPVSVAVANLMNKNR